ncbi:MAG: roadblock/LC7 domain-containing protein, partial [Candidatus Aminicenantes bacterium]|nr:roadblock/LC7 domain-containing protein [Candidatus Aminicenantes bacterium]
MSKPEKLNSILVKLQSSTSDFEASAIISEDGLMIANVLPEGLEETQIAAMSAAMMTMGTKTATELKRGNLEQLFIKGEKGYVVIMQAGPYSVLLALTSEDAKLGLVFLGMSRAVEE